MFISPYEKAGGLVWVPRMLRKIRLRASGQLPADYLPYMGLSFDRRCVGFLGVAYEALVERVAAGGTDERFSNGASPQGRGRQRLRFTCGTNT